MEFSAFSSTGSVELQPCCVCGRNFNPDTLGKHEKICRKSDLKSRQRKVFDSSKQRIQGTGASLKSKTHPGQVQAQPIKDTHWRERHLDFVNSIRSARAAQRAINTGRPLPPPPPPSQNPNYIGCPHCFRRFSPTAAERHISFCAQRTKTVGAPVKPLHKRAAADVSYSATGARKAYDNQVVRRKGSNNPYAYAQPATQDFPGMSLYSASYGARQEPETSYRQEFRSSPANAIPKYSGHAAQPRNAPRTTQANSHRSTTRSALSSGRNKSARPKSSVRFSDKVDVETFQTNGSDTVPSPHPPSPSPHPPSHPPPAYPGANGSPGNHGHQGSYRTTKASDMRLQRAQTMGNGGLGSSPQQRPLGGGGGVGSGKPLNSTFMWRDENSPSFETTTRLDSPRGATNGSHTPLQNGSFSPPRGRSSLTNSPQSYTPPLRGGGHTPSPLASPVDSSSPNSSPRHGATLESTGSGVPAPFCFHCGTQYPTHDARFCCGCGTRRAFLTANSLS